MDNEISITPFRYKYLQALKNLLESNGSPDAETVSMKNLPKTGYIAMMGGYPVAAGFLRRVEGGYGQIDTLTTNKTYGAIVRHAGILKVVESLLEDANTLKLQGIIAITTEPTVIERSKAYGFKTLTHVVIAKALT